MVLRLIINTVILFFVSGVTQIYAQIEKHPYREFNNLDKIDSIKIYYFEKNMLSKKLPKNIGKIKTKFLFEDGKITQINDYSGTGELWDIYEFEYLTDENFIVRRFDWSKELRFLWFYENGLISKAEKYSSKEELKASWKYFYERDSLLISEKKFDKKGQLEYEISQEYDTRGNRLYYKRIKKGALLSLQTFQFDSVNNVIGTEIYDVDSNLVVEYEAITDTINNSSVINKNHESNRKSGSIKYYYSDAGKITGREVFKANGKLDYREEYIYDEQNRLVKHQVYNLNKLLAEQTYDYDEHSKLEARKYYQVFLNKPRLLTEYFNTRDAQGNLEIEVKKSRETNITEVYRYYYY